MARGLRQHRRIMCALLASVQLGACTSQIDAISPSFETVQLLREKAVPSLALGKFIPASRDIGRSVAIRLSVMHAPKGQNFAEFLAASFEAELKAAGKLDPASPLRLEGVLTESHASEDLAKGGASLAATVTLMQSGKAVFSKPYRVETRWRSDFIGAIAIPEAFRQYNSLYALLVRQVLSDPELITVAKRASPK
jgi:hypothetical protein